MNKEFIIAVDLDGVLADFDRKVKEIFQDSPYDKSQMWKSIQFYNNRIKPFFESLDKTPDCDRLWSYVTTHFSEVFILSASGHVPSDGAEQKRKWIGKNFGWDVRAEIVKKSPDKAAFASPRTILIDDRSKSIDPWVAAGGIGILHRSAEQTISELERIVNESTRALAHT